MSQVLPLAPSAGFIPDRCQPPPEATSAAIPVGKATGISYPVCTVLVLSHKTHEDATAMTNKGTGLQHTLWQTSCCSRAAIDFSLPGNRVRAESNIRMLQFDIRVMPRGTEANPAPAPTPAHNFTL